MTHPGDTCNEFKPRRITSVVLPLGLFGRAQASRRQEASDRSPPTKQEGITEVVAILVAILVFAIPRFASLQIRSAPSPTCYGGARSGGCATRRPQDRVRPSSKRPRTRRRSLSRRPAGVSEPMVKCRTKIVWTGLLLTCSLSRCWPRTHRSRGERLVPSKHSPRRTPCSSGRSLAPRERADPHNTCTTTRTPPMAQAHTPETPGRLAQGRNQRIRSALTRKRSKVRSLQRPRTDLQGRASEASAWGLLRKPVPWTP